MTALAAGSVSGARGLVVAPDGAVAYVASPAVGGVQVVSLAGRGGVVQTLADGPVAARAAGRAGRDAARAGAPLLLVSNFIDHTVTVHAIGADGRLGDARQTIRTEAPVLDMVVAGEPAALLLFTHEDRPLDRAHLSVEGLDSGVIVLRAAPCAAVAGGGAVRRSGAGQARVRQPRRAGRARHRARAAPRAPMQRRSRSWAREATTCCSPTGGDAGGRRRPSTWARTRRRSRRCPAAASSPPID